MSETGVTPVAWSLPGWPATRPGSTCPRTSSRSSAWVGRTVSTWIANPLKLNVPHPTLRSPQGRTLLRENPPLRRDNHLSFRLMSVGSLVVVTAGLPFRASAVRHSQVSSMDERGSVQVPGSPARGQTQDRVPTHDRPIAGERHKATAPTLEGRPPGHRRSIGGGGGV